MTAATPGTASNSESRKRLAEQNGTHTPHWDPAVVQLIEQARAEGAAEVLTETIARIEAVTPRENLRGNERRTYWQGVRDALIVVQGQRDAALRGPR